MQPLSNISYNSFVENSVHREMDVSHLDDYHVFKLYNISHPLDADFIFLGETHYDEEVSSSHGHLLSFLALSQPINLVLEGHPLMEKLNFKFCDTVFRKYDIKSYLQENITCYGWDIHTDELLEKHNSPAFVCKLQHMLEQNYQQYENIDKILHLQFPEFFEAFRVDSEKYLLSLDLEHRHFLCTLLKNQMDLSEKQQKIVDLLNKPILSDDFLENNERSRKESHLLAIRSMNTKLANGEITGKVVFIQGACHLRLNEDLKNRGDLFSLELLYQELRNHKAAILIHNKCK